MTDLRAIAAYHHRAADILSGGHIDRDQLQAMRRHAEWAGYLDSLADEMDADHERNKP